MGIPSIFHHHKSVVFPFHNLFVSFLVIISTIAFNYKVQSETAKISRFNSHVFPFHTSHKRIWSNLQLDRGFPPPRYISVNWPPLLYCVYYYSTRKSWLNHYPVLLIYTIQNEEQIISPYQITILIGHHSPAITVANCYWHGLASPPPAALYGLWRGEYNPIRVWLDVLSKFLIASLSELKRGLDRRQHSITTHKLFLPTSYKALRLLWIHRPSQVASEATIWPVNLT